MLKPRTMTPPGGDPPSDRPYLHYMTERDRINRYSATKRTTVLASLPERCPYRARSSPKNAKKLELGWLEFHDPKPPDPEVARPGDVWIQIPLDFDPKTTCTREDDASICRLFVCYSAEGRQWTEWEGDERVHANDPPVGVHPLASPAMWDGTTRRDAQYYLAFTGSEFTWVSGTRLSIIAGQWRLGRLPGDWMKDLIAKHSIDGIPFLAPADAIVAWAERKTFTASGVQTKKMDRKRVSNEPTPELPSTKRRKPEIAKSNLGVAHGGHPVAQPDSIPHPYSFISWPQASHWTALQSSFPRRPTPPLSDTSDESMDSPTTPPSPTFVLRPATFAAPLSPANESPPLDDPPPTPPSPVPQLQHPPAEGRPPPTVYPHVSFKPTLSPPRYGERIRKRVLRSSTLPAPTRPAQSALAGPSAPAMGSTSASTPSTGDRLTSTSVSAPPTTEGRRAPMGAIDAPPGIRGKYAKAGATQLGWSLYVGETELLMPFPCDKCKRAGAICSGLEGERCGRCRAIRRPCSHNAQPRSSTSKSDPPGARFVVPVSVSAVEMGPVALCAKEWRDGAPSRRPPPGGQTVKLNHGRVPGKSATSSVALPLSPSRAQNDITAAASQDEDDNAVEDLMESDGGEEKNMGMGIRITSEIAQGAPKATITKPLDFQGPSNESRPQGVEDHEGSKFRSNHRWATDPPEGRRSPASHTVTHSFPESPIIGNAVDDPHPDPTGDPAPDCSQEVCIIHAADGAAAGGGLPSSTPATGTVSVMSSPHVDLRVGHSPVISIPPPQVTENGPAPTEQASVDDEIVRFMEITLKGMAQVQDGLRGVFAIQKRRRAVQRRKLAVGDSRD